MDKTRNADLKELYQAREGKTVRERESIEKIMHEIRKQVSSELIQAREDLVKSVRSGNGKMTKKISEKIKQMTHQKGMEHRG